MFNRLKTAVVGAVEGFEIGKSPGSSAGSSGGAASAANRHNLPHKHKYSRPAFLKLNEETMAIAADRKIRPIINTSEELLNNTGYAECVNAGKSLYNEDQAVIAEGLIRGSRPFPFRIPYHYFAVFDGHAGFGAALDASRQLHHIVNQKFLDMADDIFGTYLNPQKSMPLTRDSLIIGALESAFSDMDNVIAENRGQYYPAGGCTVLVAVFMLGRLYVANAGDSRAVLCTEGSSTSMSYDFTPVSDGKRIRLKGAENTALLGNEFSCREYMKPPKPEDLGKTVLFREPHMTGWTYRTVDDTDLRKPIISGKGRRSRVMSTIGVTRGFGDHDLVCYAKKTPIKPFLSCAPEVLIYKIERRHANQALVMATDGLWDVVGAKQAAKIVSNSFENYEAKNRWTAAATCLVSCARGSVAGGGEGGSWRMKNGRPASCDDITALIVPLERYYDIETELREEYERFLFERSQDHGGEAAVGGTARYEQQHKRRQRGEHGEGVVKNGGGGGEDKVNSIVKSAKSELGEVKRLNANIADGSTSAALPEPDTQAQAESDSDSDAAGSDMAESENTTPSGRSTRQRRAGGQTALVTAAPMEEDGREGYNDALPKRQFKMGSAKTERRHSEKHGKRVKRPLSSGVRKRLYLEFEQADEEDRQVDADTRATEKVDASSRLVEPSESRLDVASGSRNEDDEEMDTMDDTAEADRLFGVLRLEGCTDFPH